MSYPAMEQKPGEYPPQPGYAPQPGYPPPQAGYPQPGVYPPPQPGYPPGQPMPGYAPPPQGVMTTQPMPNQPPQAGGWMPVPQSVPNCPPGLEYLSTLDQVLVKQQMEVLEMVTGFETSNKYKVKNSMGQQMFFAKEDTDCCTRQCCGPLRPFDMKITDNGQNEVIHLNRPLACDSCCCPCCLQSLEVTAPPGNVIGSIEQKWSILQPKFDVLNASGEVVLKIQGPICTCSCCGDVDFEVMSAEGSVQVGKISKQWTGFGKEAFTDSDNFGVTFPIDLDVKMKAVLLGAVFLIDFMYFERQQKNN